ncbi:MAG TPA: hypothetical protein P5110_00560 [Candidatus Omnitrophota bacterium]|nr:hypothetical protein [Candidatus Omnitrophota bacterium]
MLRKICSLILIVSFICEQSGFAQIGPAVSGPAAPQAGMIADAFRPVHLRSLGYNARTRAFDLLLDRGSDKNMPALQVNRSAATLLSYFKIGLTLPNSAFWVNLRPDSPDEMIDPLVARTDLGKILLEADLQLKKDLAALTSPATPEGKRYWDKLYEKAETVFGPGNISIPTLTRPWIVPGEIILRDAGRSAYIYKATLKVMLEEDYLKGSSVYAFEDRRMQELNAYSSDLIRRLILPKLNLQVNSARRYAALRQVYYSLILAQWFKQKNKRGAYAAEIDARNLAGLTSSGKWDPGSYFKAYQKSFRDGEYNKQEQIMSGYGMTVRRYFSGGISLPQLRPVDSPAYQGRSPAGATVIAGTPVPQQVTGNLASVTIAAESTDFADADREPAQLALIETVRRDGAQLAADPKLFDFVVGLVHKQTGSSQAFMTGSDVAIISQQKLFRHLVQSIAEKTVRLYKKPVAAKAIRQEAEAMFSPNRIEEMQRRPLARLIRDSETSRLPLNSPNPFARLPQFLDLVQDAIDQALPEQRAEAQEIAMLLSVMDRYIVRSTQGAMLIGGTRIVLLDTARQENQEVRLAAELGHLTVHKFHNVEDVDPIVDEGYDALFRLLVIKERGVTRKGFGYFVRGNDDLRAIAFFNEGGWLSLLGEQTIANVVSGDLDLKDFIDASPVLKQRILASWDDAVRPLQRDNSDPIDSRDIRTKEQAFEILLQDERQYGYVHLLAGYMFYRILESHHGDFDALARSFLSLVSDPAGKDSFKNYRDFMDAASGDGGKETAAQEEIFRLRQEKLRLENHNRLLDRMMARSEAGAAFSMQRGLLEENNRRIAALEKRIKQLEDELKSPGGKENGAEIDGGKRFFDRELFDSAYDLLTGSRSAAGSLGKFSALSGREKTQFVLALLQRSREIRARVEESYDLMPAAEKKYLEEFVNAQAQPKTREAMQQALQSLRLREEARQAQQAVAEIIQEELIAAPSAAAGAEETPVSVPPVSENTRIALEKAPPGPEEAILLGNLIVRLLARDMLNGGRTVSDVDWIGEHLKNMTFPAIRPAMLFLKMRVSRASYGSVRQARNKLIERLKQGDPALLEQVRQEYERQKIARAPRGLSADNLPYAGALVPLAAAANPASVGEGQDGGRIIGQIKSEMRGDLMRVIYEQGKTGDTDSLAMTRSFQTPAVPKGEKEAKGGLPAGLVYVYTRLTDEELARDPGLIQNMVKLELATRNPDRQLDPQEVGEIVALDVPHVLTAYVVILGTPAKELTGESRPRVIYKAVIADDRGKVKLQGLTEERGKQMDDFLALNGIKNNEYAKSLGTPKNYLSNPGYRRNFFAGLDRSIARARQTLPAPDQTTLAVEDEDPDGGDEPIPDLPALEKEIAELEAQLAQKDLRALPRFAIHGQREGTELYEDAWYFVIDPDMKEYREEGIFAGPAGFLRSLLGTIILVAKYGGMRLSPDSVDGTVAGADIYLFRETPDRELFDKHTQLDSIKQGSTSPLFDPTKGGFEEYPIFYLEHQHRDADVPVSTFQFARIQLGEQKIRAGREWADRNQEISVGNRRMKQDPRLLTEYFVNRLLYKKILAAIADEMLDELPDAPELPAGNQGAKGSSGFSAGGTSGFAEGGSFGVTDNNVQGIDFSVLAAPQETAPGWTLWSQEALPVFSGIGSADKIFFDTAFFGAAFPDTGALLDTRLIQLKNPHASDLSGLTALLARTDFTLPEELSAGKHILPDMEIAPAKFIPAPGIFELSLSEAAVNKGRLRGILEALLRTIKGEESRRVSTATADVMSGDGPDGGAAPFGTTGGFSLPTTMPAAGQTTAALPRLTGTDLLKSNEEFLRQLQAMGIEPALYEFLDNRKEDYDVRFLYALIQALLDVPQEERMAAGDEMVRMPLPANNLPTAILFAGRILVKSRQLVLLENGGSLQFNDFDRYSDTIMKTAEEYQRLFMQTGFIEAVQLKGSSSMQELARWMDWLKPFIAECGIDSLVRLSADKPDFIQGLVFYDREAWTAALRGRGMPETQIKLTLSQLAVFKGYKDDRWFPAPLSGAVLAARVTAQGVSLVEAYLLSSIDLEAQARDNLVRSIQARNRQQRKELIQSLIWLQRNPPALEIVNILGRQSTRDLGNIVDGLSVDYEDLLEMDADHHESWFRMLILLGEMPDEDAQRYEYGDSLVFGQIIRVIRRESVADRQRLVREILTFQPQEREFQFWLEFTLAHLPLSDAVRAKARQALRSKSSPYHQAGLCWVAFLAIGQHPEQAEIFNALITQLRPEADLANAFDTLGDCLVRFKKNYLSELLFLLGRIEENEQEQVAAILADIASSKTLPDNTDVFRYSPPANKFAHQILEFDFANRELGFALEFVLSLGFSGQAQSVLREVLRPLNDVERKQFYDKSLKWLAVSPEHMPAANAVISSLRPGASAGEALSRLLEIITWSWSMRKEDLVELAWLTGKINAREKSLSLRLLGAMSPTFKEPIEGFLSQEPVQGLTVFEAYILSRAGFSDAAVTDKIVETIRGGNDQRRVALFRALNWLKDNSRYRETAETIIRRSSGQGQALVDGLNFLATAAAMQQKKVLSAEEINAAAQSGDFSAALISRLESRIGDKKFFDFEMGPVHPDARAALADTEFMMDMFNFQQNYPRRSAAYAILRDLVIAYFTGGRQGVRDYKRSQANAASQAPQAVRDAYENLESLTAEAEEDFSNRAAYRQYFETTMQNYQQHSAEREMVISEADKAYQARIAVLEQETDEFLAGQKTDPAGLSPALKAALDQKDIQVLMGLKKLSKRENRARGEALRRLRELQRIRQQAQDHGILVQKVLEIAGRIENLASMDRGEQWQEIIRLYESYERDPAVQKELTVSRMIDDLAVLDQEFAAREKPRNFINESRGMLKSLLAAAQKALTDESLTAAVPAKVSAEISFDLKDTLKIGRYGASGSGNCQRSDYSGNYKHSLMSFISDAQELIILLRDGEENVIGFVLLHGVFTESGEFVYVKEKVYTNTDELKEVQDAAANAMTREVSAALGVRVLARAAKGESFHLKVPPSRVTRYLDSLGGELDLKEGDATAVKDIPSFKAEVIAGDGGTAQRLIEIIDNFGREVSGTVEAMKLKAALHDLERPGRALDKAIALHEIREKAQLVETKQRIELPREMLIALGLEYINSREVAQEARSLIITALKDKPGIELSAAAEQMSDLAAGLKSWDNMIIDQSLSVLAVLLETAGPLTRLQALKLLSEVCLNQKLTFSQEHLLFKAFWDRDAQDVKNSGRIAESLTAFQEQVLPLLAVIRERMKAIQMNVEEQERGIEAMVREYEAQQAAQSRPLEPAAREHKPDETGGIDLRSLPVSGSSPAPAWIAAPVALNPAAALQAQDLQVILAQGRLLKPQEIICYVQQCYQQGRIAQARQEILALLAQELKMEETQGIATDTSLKETLIWLETQIPA